MTLRGALMGTRTRADEDLRMSAPPPSSTPPGSPSAPREVLLALDSGRSWRKSKRPEEDCLRLSTMGVVIEGERLLRQPLRLGIGTISVGCVDPGPARAHSGDGRFPIPPPLGPTPRAPRAAGIQGGS